MMTLLTPFNLSPPPKIVLLRPMPRMVLLEVTSFMRVSVISAARRITNAPGTATAIKKSSALSTITVVPLFPPQVPPFSVDQPTFGLTGVVEGVSVWVNDGDCDGVLERELYSEGVVDLVRDCDDVRVIVDVRVRDCVRVPERDRVLEGVIDFVRDWVKVCVRVREAI